MADFKTLMNDVKKKYGDGTVIVGSDVPKTPIMCGTGSVLLDYALGCGGIPRGRIIEIYGPASGGKSTMCLHFIREAQRNGLGVGYIDAENSFDSEWAKNIGVDVSNLLVAQPSSGDEAFDIADMMCKSGEVKLIIVDSVSALTPKAVLEGEYSQNHIGQLARLMSQSLNKLTPVVAKNNCCVIFINQIRMKIGGYGNPETTSGGESLKFYASIRMEVRRGEVLGDKEDVDGFLTKIKVVKNKCGVPFRKVETNLYLGKNGKYGIDKNEEYLDLAVEKELIKRAGAWYSYNEERLGQGKEKSYATILANEAIFNEIKKQVQDTVIGVSQIAENSFANAIEDAAKDVEKPKRKKRGEAVLENVEELSIVEEDVSEAEVVEE